MGSGLFWGGLGCFLGALNKGILGIAARLQLNSLPWQNLRLLRGHLLMLGYGWLFPLLP